MPLPRRLLLLPWLVLVWASCQVGEGLAAPGTQAIEVPGPLQPWVPWVLDGRDPRPCPLVPEAVRSGAPPARDDPADRLCAWPGRLSLDLGPDGGGFAQRWSVYTESWVPLPGDPQAWPQDTQSGDGTLTVVPRAGRPAVKLPPGEHRLRGRFEWTGRPEGLALPPATGLVELVLDGTPVAVPRRDRDGRLWLTDPGQTGPGQEAERLGLRVYRRIDDDLPLRLTTRLVLEVAGQARLLTLGPVAPRGGIPLRLQSPIPARLGEDGRLQLQVRPGSWVVELETQHPGLVETLTRVPADPPWPESEVWSFAARPDLRQVEVSGAPGLDPLQSGVPPEWSRFPAYQMGQEASLSLATRRRGDPDPGPDRLSLARDLWLDFQGGGLSVRDHLAGTLTRSWRLELAPPLRLGQVRVDGEPRLITRLVEGDPPGVEVRRGQLQLLADSRLEGRSSRLPVSGWRLELGSTRTRLHLPPGWDLLAVAGVDNLPPTWLARWTLLDLFLVLILSLGVARLWGWSWGLIGLLALVLTWQAPGAPRMVWLHLLAAAALLRFLPEGSGRVALGRLQGLVLWYFRLALLALLLVGLPFLVGQVRDGIWPQLERPWSGPGVGLGVLPGTASTEALDEGEDRDSESLEAGSPEAGSVGGLRSKVARPAAAPGPRSPTPSPLDSLEPGARVQTGPGIPDWDWRAFDLHWNGPVTPEETAQLWLLTPGWHLVWSLSGALLVTLLGLRLAGLIGRRVGPGPGASGASPSGVRVGTGAGTVLPVLPLLLLLSPPGDARAAEAFPTPELLGELRARLLAPPDCLPDCVDLPRLDLRAEGPALRLSLTLDAVVPVATPIPGGAGGWVPETLTLDGGPLDAVLQGAGDRLLVPLPEGRHRLELMGPLPDLRQVEIPLPMGPRQIRSELSGWALEGLDAAGRAGSQIRLVRLEGPGEEAERPLVPEALPPLVAVERALSLGLDWRVETRVRRLSPAEPPLLVPIPLLSGESVQTPGVQVGEGQVLASLGPGVRETGWSSRLETTPRLQLQASSDPQITDSWSLDLSPRWHLSWSGIPPVGQGAEAGRWTPTWRPLPGEVLELGLARPEAIPGPTLTLDRVELLVRPGRRASASELRLSLRSTLGGTHAIRLPTGAEPVRLLVDGQERPLPPDGADLELPLTPGRQAVTIEWREPTPLAPMLRPRGPDLGIQAVNLNLSLSLPEDRWVLLATGPQMGPVVLFWPLLLVLVGLALALGRVRLTPLRTLDWLLLGVGLSLAQIWVALLVAGWLFALGLRPRMTEETPRWRYNLTQVALVLLTIAALGGLVAAVSEGLLGRPDMQILGNGSRAGLLNWYQDRGGPELPEVSVLSVPIWVYRALMLAWALWLALRLLDWLRWGWNGFSRPVVWREGPPRPARPIRMREAPVKP